MNKKIYKDTVYILNLKANMLVKPYEVTNNRKAAHFDGAIPFSLYTVHHQEYNKETFKYDKLANGYMSYSFVSVDFGCSYKILDDEDKELFFTNGKKVEKKKGTYKVKMKSDELREYLYENGFDLIINGVKYHYVYNERTGSKSRVGNAVFVKEQYFDELVNHYMLMDLDFSKVGPIDIPALETYKSLVCSGLTDITDDIDPNKICIVDDINLSYKTVSSVTSFENGEIKQEDKLYEVINNATDGEGIGDISIIKHDMCLLRNKFFKCCVKSFRVRDFKNKYNIEYFTDKWGNKFYDDDIIITTPSSLKLFKFSDLFFENDEECFNYWKEHCDKHFGIVKYNKSNGNFDGRYGQLSYQVVNSLPASYSDMLELMSDELQYISNLRSNDETYFKNHINSNSTIYTDDFVNTMSSLNNDFYKTKLYRKVKSETISEYVSQKKCSKILIKGLDYYTVFSLPQLLARKASGLDYSWDLEGNIGYCPSFKEDELFCFRNPHISTSCLCTFENKMFDSDLQFFPLDEGNVVILNTKNNMQNQLGGMDFDSDVIAICSNKKLIELSKKNNQFKVPVLDIEPSKIQLEYNNKNLARCDYVISQQKIGEIVNLSALLLSYYYDIYNKDKKDDRLKLLSDMINLLSNASMCEIDSAKKSYPKEVRSAAILKFVREKCKDILEKEVINVSKHKLSDLEFEEFENTKDKSILTKEKETYVKPNFFKFAQKDYKDQYSFRKFNCSSDFIVDILDNFQTRLQYTKTIEVDELLVKNKNFEHSNRHQIQTIIDKLKSYKNEYVSLKCNKNLDTLEKMIECDRLHNNLIEQFEKMRITDETIYCMLVRMFNRDEGKRIIDSSKNKQKTEENIKFLRNNRLLILNTLCVTHKEEFKKCFNNFKQDVEVLVEDETGTIEIWGKKYRKEII